MKEYLILVLLILIIFACGFGVGSRMNYVPKQVETQDTKSSHEQINQIQAVEQNKTAQVAHVKKTFYKTGKIKTEEIDQISQVDLSKEINTKKFDLNVIQDIKQKEIDFKKNLDFFIGLTYPIPNLTRPFDYASVSFMFGYRIIYNFFIFAETNLTFNRYSLGVLYLF
jgi:hypothetical protein